jgi:hypothetical protein
VSPNVAGISTLLHFVARCCKIGKQQAANFVSSSSDREEIMSAPIDFPENQVMLTAPGGLPIQGMSYVANSLVFTDGQDPAPSVPTASASGTTWTISLHCGRKNSSGPANAFNQAVTGADLIGSAATHMYAYHGGGGTPDELNFCFAMNVNFGNFSTVLYFGQGSTSSPFPTNNWWIGGNGVINVLSELNNSNPVILLLDNNNLVYFMNLSGDGSNQFFLDADAKGAM